MRLWQRLLIVVALVTIPLIIGLMFTYEIIKVDWISFMEIQPSFKPMENPLPVPADSIPVEGAAYIRGMGAPINPVQADKVSLARGQELYSINCSLCHGPNGKGGTIVGSLLAKKPADLTAATIHSRSDGAIFMVISNGVPGTMPALNENLDVRSRWDVVNFIRTLK